MPHDPREIGRQIGGMIVAARKEASDVVQAPIEPSRVIVEAPIEINVPETAVNVETDAIVTAIAEAKFDPSDLVTVIAEAANTIAAIDLSGLGESIERIDNNQSLADLADRMEASTKILAETQNNNANALADAVLSLTKGQDEQSQSMIAAVKALIDALDLQDAKINQIGAMQQELIQIGYARRMLIMDSEGDPIGLQVERQVN